MASADGTNAAGPARLPEETSVPSSASLNSPSAASIHDVCPSSVLQRTLGAFYTHCASLESTAPFALPTPLHPKWRLLQSADMPEAHRLLLDHHRNMTPTLAAFHGAEMKLKVLWKVEEFCSAAGATGKISSSSASADSTTTPASPSLDTLHSTSTASSCSSDSQQTFFGLKRAIILFAAAGESETVCEFATIRINASAMPATMHSAIRAGKLPFGTLLQQFGVQQRAVPIAFFALRRDALLDKIFGVGPDDFDEKRENDTSDASTSSSDFPSNKATAPDAQCACTAPVAGIQQCDNPDIQSELSRNPSAFVFGRVNLLVTPQHVVIAEVVEILPSLTSQMRQRFALNSGKYSIASQEVATSCASPAPASEVCSSAVQAAS